MALTNKKDYAFVRNEDAPILPPPATEVGFSGWLWQNIFSSMADFKSASSSIRSIFIALITILLAYFCFIQFYSVIDFAIISAVWSDPEGLKREVCWTVEQGGSLPSGWHGACWPFVWAKQKFLLYGSYPSEHVWRVNLAIIIGLVGLVYVMIENLPYRFIVGVFLLTVYPVLAFVLLTGGNSDATAESLLTGLIFGLAVISVGRIGGRGFLGSNIKEFAQIINIIGWECGDLLYNHFFDRC